MRFFIGMTSLPPLLLVSAVPAEACLLQHLPDGLIGFKRYGAQI
jgi:hypothetical protein